MIEGFKVKNRIYVLTHNKGLQELDNFAKVNEGTIVNPTDNSQYRNFVHRGYQWNFKTAKEAKEFVDKNQITIWNKNVAIDNQRYVFENSDDFDDFSGSITIGEYLGIDKYDPWSNLPEDQAKITRRQTNVTGDSFNDREKKGEITIETIEGKKNGNGKIKIEDIESIVATIDRPEFFEEKPDVDENGNQVTKKD